MPDSSPKEAAPNWYFNLWRRSFSDSPWASFAPRLLLLATHFLGIAALLIAFAAWRMLRHG